MKKRLLKFIGIGLGVDVAFVAIPLLFSSVGYFLSTGEFPRSSIQDVFSGDFAAIYPFIFLSTIGLCLVFAVTPFSKKESREQAPKEYRIAVAFETVGLVFISIGAALLLRLGYTKHESLVMTVTILSFSVAIAVTTSLLIFAHKTGRKKNWRYILDIWIPALLILLIAHPWTDKLPSSGGFSLPSIGLFNQEKEITSGVITESIRVTQDSLYKNGYLVKCTVRNAGRADARAVVMTLYYYNYDGMERVAGSETVQRIHGGESYTFTVRIVDTYIKGVQDPYLRILYAADT